MTPNEARKLAAIISNIDGGCIVCVTGATQELHKHFPEHDWPQLIVTAGWNNYGREPESALNELRNRLRDF